MPLRLPARPLLLWAVRVLSFSAMSISLWLFSRKLTGDISSIAGCGGAGECEEVMGGAWSEWFHIPVTALAAVLHVGVIFLTLPSLQRVLGRTGDQLLAAAGVTLAAAALYFLGILYLVEKKWCPWCFALHVIGISAAAIILGDAVRMRRQGERGVLEAALLTGFMAIGMLAAGQVWGPKPLTYELTHGDLPGDQNPPPPAQASPASSSTGPARVAGFFNDAFRFDAAALPLLGRPDARVILVEFFDYTCPSCRRLAGHLKALKKKWPDTFGVIVLPSPLNRSCNPWLRDTIDDHQGACDLAKLSLAMWRAQPGKFPVFHEYLLELPLPVTPQKVEAARRKADDLAGPVVIAAALEDAWVSERLQQNVSTYAKLSTQSIVMPKLLLHTSVMMHGPASNPEEFIRMIEMQFDLTGTGSPVITKPK